MLPNYLLIHGGSESGYEDHWINAMLRCDSIRSKVIYTRNNNETFNLIDRVLNKFNIALDKSGINKRILNELSVNVYDVLFVSKGVRVYPRTLKKIKLLYPDLTLVSFSGDNMTKWNNKSLFYHFGINYYDIVFGIDIPDYRLLSKLYTGRLIHIDKCFESRLHKPLSKFRMNFRFNVLFVGSFEKDRFKSLNYLASNGIKIDVFGNMWEKCKFSIHPNLIIHYKELINEDYVKAIYEAKITLGFLRQINKDTQTSRTFEIPASGGFMLMQRTSDHKRLFVEGKDAEYFSSNSELLYKVNYYLNNNNERESIAMNGRRKCLSENYDYDSRINKMIKDIGDFYKSNP